MLELLCELVTVAPGCLSDYVGQLVPGLQFSFAEKNANTNVKIDTLFFIGRFIATHPSEHMVPVLPALVKASLGVCSQA